MVTFWLAEAMGRVSNSLTVSHDSSAAKEDEFAQVSRSKTNLKEHPYLQEMRNNAYAYFENILLFANHLGIFSEEVNHSGEQMGNTPQAFSHLACVSAAMNLER